MTLTVQISRPMTQLDRLIDQFRNAIGFFAAQPRPAAEEPDDDQGDSVPPTNDATLGPDQVLGDPVDTSQHDPRTPAEEAGVRPATRKTERKSKEAPE